MRFLIAGFWVIQVKSKEEAIEWAKRVPFEGGEVGRAGHDEAGAQFARAASLTKNVREQQLLLAGARSG
jgi:YCII-related domain